MNESALTISSRFIVSTAIAIWIAKDNSVYCENYIILKHRCYMNGFGKLNPRKFPMFYSPTKSIV